MIVLINVLAYFIRNRILSKIFLFLMIISFGVLADNDYLKIEASHLVEENGNSFTVNQYGSAVRWNDDYIVTAKHLDFVQGSKYKCSENCDLQFVKYKGKSLTPKWRERVPYEDITIVGNSPGSKTIISKGQDLNLKYYVSNTKIESVPYKKEQVNALVYASNAKVIQGQSGGPVFGNNGDVIGMVIGNTILTSAKTGQEFEVSLYIPYSVIEKEWLKFQKRIK